MVSQSVPTMNKRPGNNTPDVWNNVYAYYCARTNTQASNTQKDLLHY